MDLKARRSRNVAALLYAGGSAIVFAVRLVYAVAKAEYKTPGDEFFLVICAVGLAVCLPGSIYLAVKIGKARDRAAPDRP